MDTIRIRYFTALAQLQHVRKAAEVLRINPATLSRAIKTLENDINLKLIAPAGRGIELTEGGKVFYQKSLIFLKAYDALLGSTQTISSDDRQIRMGSLEVFTTYFLTHLLADKKIEQKLRVLYLTPGKIEEALKSGKIDIGITYIRLADTELNYLKVGTFKMGVYGNPVFKKVAFKDLKFAVPVDGLDTPSIKLRSLDGWDNEKYPRRVQYELELLESSLQMARMGKAVVYCPDFIAKLHNQALSPQFHLHEIESASRIKQTQLPIYIVQRKNSEETNFVRSLAKAVRSLK